jgi:hypothetical protein
MKKLMKILGIMTAALLVGGMIIACTHADLGYDTSKTPDHTAPALVAGGGNGGGGDEDTSVPQAFKDAAYTAYAIDPADFADTLALLGLSNLPPNPHNWTDAQWAQVYALAKEHEEEEETPSGGVPQSFKTGILAMYEQMGVAGFGTILSSAGLGSLPSNPNTWTNAQWAQAYAVMGGYL